MTAIKANAMMRTVEVTPPGEALLDLIVALADEVHAGSHVAVLLDDVATASRRLGHHESEVNRLKLDLAVQTLLRELPDLRWDLTPEQAADQASRWVDAALEARGLFECPCGTIRPEAEAVWDEMHVFRRCSADCWDAAGEHAQAGAAS
jgi:hypothetical protein